MSEILTHLWSSTLVLVIALIIARLVPLTARTRYALLVCVLLKFAVPAVAIVGPLRLVGIGLANLGGRTAGAISMQWVGGPPTLRTLAAKPASRWPEALAIGWIVSAAALALAWAIARRRLVSSALATTCNASPRERAALVAARRQVGLRTSVDIVRSTICEAPAVVRIVRPVVVLPDGGCDALADAELESLLRHECAHVARRDNLAGLVESAIVAAFWFHPLVWFAQRAIAIAREEACDEAAAASSADTLETYMSALSKICRAVLASRLAGVSCMASAHLKERLNHLMRYEVLRRRALSHPFVVAFAAIAVLAVTIGSGVHAAPASDSKDPYRLNWSVRPGDLPDRLDFRGRVFETETGLLVAEPSVTFPRNSTATIRTGTENREVFIDIRDLGTQVSVVMRVMENGVQRQESKYLAVAKADTQPRNKGGRPYTGDPISLDLKDADVKDVIRTFATITGTKITFDPSLEGRVTLRVKDMPWDQAFDLVLQQNNLSYELKGDAIVIKR